MGKKTPTQKKAKREKRASDRASSQVGFSRLKAAASGKPTLSDQITKAAAGAAEKMDSVPKKMGQQLAKGMKRRTR